MDAAVRYISECPSWTLAVERLRAALDAAGHADVPVRHELVTTAAEADLLGFVGSPTIAINGRDVYAQPGSPTGLACRLYRTPEGLAGSPSEAQLKQAIAGVV